MIIKRTSLGLALVMSFVFSAAALAHATGGNSSRSGGGVSRDTGAEMNNDPQFRAEQLESRYERGHGYRLEDVESGRPMPGDRGFCSFRYFNDMTRNHH